MKRLLLLIVGLALMGMVSVDVEATESGDNRLFYVIYSSTYNNYSWNNTCFNQRRFIKYETSLGSGDFSDNCLGLLYGVTDTLVGYYFMNATNGSGYSLVNVSFDTSGWSEATGNAVLDLYEYPNNNPELHKLYWNPTYSNWDTQLCTDTWDDDNTTGNCIYHGNFTQASPIPISGLWSNSTYPVFLLKRNNYTGTAGYYAPINNDAIKLLGSSWGNVTTSTSTTITTTTTLLAPFSPQCNSSLDCFYMEACVNGTCIDVSSTAQCTIDPDCGSGFFCNTYQYGVFDAVCRFKGSIGTSCIKNHECLSWNCTTDSINPANIYPYSDVGYAYGFCSNSSLEFCNVTADCSSPSTDYCNVVSESFPLGYCDTRKSTDEGCVINDECVVGASCFDGVCQFTNYTGGHCNPSDITNEEYSTPLSDVIWSVCNGKGSCVSDYDCFCNGTGYCVERVGRWGACEYEYGSTFPQSGVCNINDWCLGEQCVPEEWDCNANLLANDSQPSGFGAEQFCSPDTLYCELSTHLCRPRKVLNESCTYSYACGVGLDCINGQCRSEEGSEVLSGQSLIVEMDKYSYKRGEGVSDIYAWNRFMSSVLEDSFCRWWSSEDILDIEGDGVSAGDLVFSIGDVYRNDYFINVKSNAPAGIYTLTVLCTNPNYPSIYNSTTFEVKTVSADLVWDIIPPSNREDSANYIRVKFSEDASTPVLGASCDFYIDKIYSTTLTDDGGGFYSGISTYYPSAGVHKGNVTCTKGGIGTLSITSSFVITSDVPVETCYNGRWDLGENGVDCGGICLQSCPSYCDDECGGVCEPCDIGESCNVNSDCLSKWCRNGVCSQPSCSDGIKNGDEVLVDCGGSQCSPCGCSDPYWLGDCTLDDGSMVCNTSLGYCVDTPVGGCLSDSQCDRIRVWGDDSKSYLVWKNRRCIFNRCSFSQSYNISTSFGVYPLSGVAFVDGVGDWIFLAVCDDETNGFRVVTQESTTKDYQLVPSSKGVSVPQTIGVKPFGTVGTDTSALIPELCSWSGSSPRYSIVRLRAYSGGSSNQEDIDVIVFKSGFEANVTPSQTYDMGMIFELSRDGMCYVRRSSFEPYINVSAVAGTLFDVDYYLLANTTSPEWLCNSSYGETKTGSFSKDGYWLIFWIVGIIWNLLFGWIVWQNWFILIIIFGVMIILPLVYLMVRERRYV